jgi:hypothetical protein
MYLKLMGPENAPDEDSRKIFTAHGDVKSVRFARKKDAATVLVHFDNYDCEEFILEGNAYLMNDAGKTIASFGVSPIPAPA